MSNVKYLKDLKKFIRVNWSKKYRSCQSCSTTNIPYQACGLCRECYIKKWRTDTIKQIQQESLAQKRKKEQEKERLYKIQSHRHGAFGDYGDEVEYIGR